MRCWIVITFLIVMPFVSFSQRQSNINHYLGGNFGFTSGKGLSYQLSNAQFGWQTSMFYLPESRFYSRLNVGTMFIHYFHQVNHTRLFNYVSSSFRAIKKDASQYNVATNSYIIQTKFDYNLNLGVGHGLSFNLSKRAIFNFQIGYALYYLQMRNPQTFLTCETSLLFKLNSNE